MRHGEPWYITGLVPVGIASNGATIFRDESDSDDVFNRRPKLVKEYHGKDWWGSLHG